MYAMNIGIKDQMLNRMFWGGNRFSYTRFMGFL